VPAPQRRDNPDAHAEAEPAHNRASKRVDDWRRKAVRRIGGVHPGPVHGTGIVDGNVDGGGIRRHDDDRSLRRGHGLLGGRDERPRRLGSLAQTLHRVHDAGLVGEKRITDGLCPVEGGLHHAQDVGKRDERLDARIPRLQVEGSRQSEAGQGCVRGILKPARRVDDLERVGRRHQDLPE
jgi:hypothetical protein